MHNRLIVRLTIFMLIILSGCSSSRKSKSVPGILPSGLAYAEMISGIISNNITEGGFILKRGRIELEGTEIEGSFGINARLNHKGDFFASVRGPLGIELARLVNVGNDIALIDRINRTVYVGKKDEVMKRKGMPEDFLKIIFGDIPDVARKHSGPLKDGVVKLNIEENEFEREIDICLNEMKVCSEKITAPGYSGREFLLLFSDFRVTSDRKYASLIQLDDQTGMFHVKLNIDELTTGYVSDIDFTLPSYKRMSL